MRRTPGQGDVDQPKPFKVDLVEGKSYLYCGCGRSFKQPFCDSSHAGSGFWPKRFRAEKSGTFILCGCKQTKNPPYCDGAHKNLWQEAS